MFASCQGCNLKMRKKFVVPVLFHNFTGDKVNTFLVMIIISMLLFCENILFSPPLSLFRV